MVARKTTPRPGNGARGWTDRDWQRLARLNGIWKGADDPVGAMSAWLIGESPPEASARVRLRVARHLLDVTPEEYGPVVRIAARRIEQQIQRQDEDAADGPDGLDGPPAAPQAVAERRRHGHEAEPGRAPEPGDEADAAPEPGPAPGELELPTPRPAEQEPAEDAHPILGDIEPRVIGDLKLRQLIAGMAGAERGINKLTVAAPANGDPQEMVREALRLGWTLPGAVLGLLEYYETMALIAHAIPNGEARRKGIADALVWLVSNHDVHAAVLNAARQKRIARRRREAEKARARQAMGPPETAHSRHTATVTTPGIIRQLGVRDALVFSQFAGAIKKRGWKPVSYFVGPTAERIGLLPNQAYKAICSLKQKGYLLTETKSHHGSTKLKFQLTNEGRALAKNLPGKAGAPGKKAKRGGRKIAVHTGFVAGSLGLSPRRPSLAPAVVLSQLLYWLSARPKESGYQRPPSRVQLFDENGDRALRVKISRTELAEQTGLSPEQVKRAIEKLTGAGMIRSTGENFEVRTLEINEPGLAEWLRGTERTENR